MSQKLAIFDVDGTLFEGNLGIEFLKVLMQKELFPPEIGKEILSWYGKYKSGEVDKATAVDAIYELYAEGMANNQVSDVSQAAQETWAAVSEKVYPFTSELIPSLQNKGFKVILLSGSPIEMITMLANHLKLGSQAAVAGILEITDDIYTGAIISYPGSAEQKITELNKYLQVNEIEVDWSNSIAMGDNERDEQVLRKVGKGLAFEPNEALKQLAKSSGWQIVDRNHILNLMNAI